MIQLYQRLVCDEFKVNANEYKSNPSKADQARIRFCEQEIIERTEEFLSDPEWYVNEWELLTGEDMPEQYLKGIPMEISSLVASEAKKTVEGFRLRLLPLMKAGKCIKYDDSRLVEDFLSQNQKVYIFKDSIMEHLSS